MLDALTARHAQQWAVVARALLQAHYDDLNRLNVFPVADADTGTNLLLSYAGALDRQLREPAAERTINADNSSLQDTLDDFGQALVLSARGNSGVIMSQLVKGFADQVRQEGLTELDGPALARALQAAARAAHAAVTQPVPGTMLTVADDVAAAAQQAAADGGSLAQVTDASLHEAQASLARTTALLPQLQRAGVVDAGGAGYVLLVQALQCVVEAGGNLAHLAGQTTELIKRHTHSGSQPGSAAPIDNHGPRHEVSYVVTHSSQGQIDELSSALDTLGDSVVIGGGPQVWRVHVHTDEPTAAFHAGERAGQISQGAVVPLRQPSQAVGVLAVATGSGIAEVMADAGAHVLLTSAAQPVTADDLVGAGLAMTSSPVVLLPSDSSSAQQASLAAERVDDAVVVAGATTPVQALAALAVFDPTAPVAASLESMNATIADTAVACVAPGGDVVSSATASLEKLVTSSSEIVTIVVGRDAPGGTGADLESVVRRCSDAEVVIVAGDQRDCPVVIGVE